MAKSKKPRGTIAAAKTYAKSGARATPGPPRVYELSVSLVSGQITEEFAKANPIVRRTILIRADQTLVVLHEVIFDAFDRFDAHMYEFQVGGKRPMDRAARSYVLPSAMGNAFDDEPPGGDVTRTTVGSLGLSARQVFWYWFDFGDDWWHHIKVAAVHDRVERGPLPCVTERTGASPPQYPSLDDEGDDDADDDEEE